ncbi:high-affinity iron permease [Rhodosporidiobolus nylandii]
MLFSISIFFIVLRETIEAGLVVSILLSLVDSLAAVEGGDVSVVAQKQLKKRMRWMPAMPRSAQPSFAILAVVVALLSLFSAAQAASVFTAANGCPTALAARVPANNNKYGPRGAPVAGVDYDY